MIFRLLANSLTFKTGFIAFSIRKGFFVILIYWLNNFFFNDWVFIMSVSVNALVDILILSYAIGNKAIRLRLFELILWVYAFLFNNPLSSNWLKLTYPFFVLSIIGFWFFLHLVELVINRVQMILLLVNCIVILNNGFCCKATLQTVNPIHLLFVFHCHFLIF